MHARPVPAREGVTASGRSTAAPLPSRDQWPRRGGEHVEREALLTARTIALRAGVAVASISAVGILAGVGGGAGFAAGDDTQAATATQEAQENRLRAQIRRERARHDRVLATAVRHERAQRKAAVRRALRAGGATGSVDHAIRVGAATFGVSPSRLRAVAHCESTLNPAATNGPYAGLFQFGTPLWSKTPVSEFSRTDPYAAALAAGWAFSRGMSSHWPHCGR